MKAQLTVNGQTVEVELSTEQLQQLGVEEKRVKKWDDIGRIKGWYIDEYSSIYNCTGYSSDATNKNIFATENQARSALAIAQLAQLMKHVNVDWKPDWNDSRQVKYTIEIMYQDVIDIYARDTTRMFIAFPTFDVAKQFLEDHRALIEEYFLMYK